MEEDVVKETLKEHFKFDTFKSDLQKDAIYEIVKGILLILYLTH